MPPQEIKKVLVEKPFIPFRLYVSDGSSYDVLDPADAYVDMLYVSVGLEPDAESGLFRRSVRISPNHVTRILPLPELRKSAS